MSKTVSCYIEIKDNTHREWIIHKCKLRGVGVVNNKAYPLKGSKYFRYNRLSNMLYPYKKSVSAESHLVFPEEEFFDNLPGATPIKLLSIKHSHINF